MNGGRAARLATLRPRRAEVFGFHKPYRRSVSIAGGSPPARRCRRCRSDRGGPGCCPSLLADDSGKCTNAANNAKRNLRTCHFMTTITPATSEVPVASPLTTGQAGGQFEQHVDRVFLALLLVRAIPPLLTDCIVESVSFQTAFLGWRTDDLLVKGRREDGNLRRFAAQVKRSFTVSAKNDDCKETFLRFWHDFWNSTLFDAEADCFAIVTLRGTDTLLRHFAAVLGRPRMRKISACDRRRMPVSANSVRTTAADVSRTSSTTARRIVRQLRRR